LDKNKAQHNRGFFMLIVRRLDVEQRESLINSVPEEENDHDTNRDEIEA